MSTPPDNFADREALRVYIQEREIGSLLIDYRKLEAYAGMVLGIGMIFDTRKGTYDLDLQWISFGLDLYAENLLENHLYRFGRLESLLDYLRITYAIEVADIPVKYSIDSSQYPNPIKDEAQKPVFEAAWQRFQQDFQAGIFLDSSLERVYTTQEDLK